MTLCKSLRGFLFCPGGATAVSDYDLFISYSHEDRDWVTQKLLPRLEGAGLKVAIDYRDFELGVPSIVNMSNFVERSRHILLVLTPRWVSSQWTSFEGVLAGTVDPIGETESSSRSCWRIAIHQIGSNLFRSPISAPHKISTPGSPNLYNRSVTATALHRMAHRAPASGRATYRCRRHGNAKPHG